MKPAILLLSGAGIAAVLGGASYLAFSQTPAHSESHGDVTGLRNQVDELSKRVSTLQSKLDSQMASASPVENTARQTAQLATPKTADDNPAGKVSSVDRDAVFALIKEERDLREKERQEKLREQAKDNLERGVKRAAERSGLDVNTSASLVKLYLDNWAREEDIRRAYPVNGFDDPNAEKRRLELEASRKTLDASMEGLIPADKMQEWNRQGRFLRRAGDMASFAEQTDLGNFPMFGGGGRGPGGNAMLGGGGGNNNGGGGNNRRGNRNDGQSGSGGGSATGGGGGAAATGAGAAEKPAPPKPPGGGN